LAKHRDCQEKLRAEINETLEKIKERGDSDFTANDFENMPYLVAVGKVRRNRLFVPIKRGARLIKSLHRKFCGITLLP